MTGTCEPASAGDSGVSCNVPCEVECAPAQRCADPQEYIFDGGDRDPQVRLREDLTQTGLDPEDTVIQYTTKTGVTEVQSGCRVAIYAPRFGSVRKRTGILTTDLALRPQAAILPNGPGMLKEQLPPVNVMVPLKPNTTVSLRLAILRMEPFQFFPRTAFIAFLYLDRFDLRTKSDELRFTALSRPLRMPREPE